MRSTGARQIGTESVCLHAAPGYTTFSFDHNMRQDRQSTFIFDSLCLVSSFSRLLLSAVTG